MTNVIVFKRSSKIERRERDIYDKLRDYMQNDSVQHARVCVTHQNGSRSYISLGHAPDIPGLRKISL